MVGQHKVQAWALHNPVDTVDASCSFSQPVLFTLSNFCTDEQQLAAITSGPRTDLLALLTKSPLLHPVLEKVSEKDQLSLHSMFAFLC